MKYVGRGYVDGGATAAAAAAIAAALALAVIHRIRLIMVVISRIMVAGRNTSGPLLRLTDRRLQCVVK